MDGSLSLCADCAHSVEHAFAQLRSLTTSYLRGEIQLRAFSALSGEILLCHDMGVAQRKLDAQLAVAKESGQLGAAKHRLAEPEYGWPATDPPQVDAAGNPLSFCEDPDCDGHGADS